MIGGYFRKQAGGKGMSFGNLACFRKAHSKQGLGLDTDRPGRDRPAQGLHSSFGLARIEGQECASAGH
jgi:hypothetical protein